MIKEFSKNSRSVIMREVTFQEAQLIADQCFNMANRDVKHNDKLKGIVEAMQKNVFPDNTTLHFAKNGVLIDGHHRITAQCLAKRDVVYIISLGEDYENVATMDIGSPRKNTDTLQMTLRECGLDLKGDKLRLVSSLHLHCVNNGDKTDNLRFTGSGSSNEEIRHWAQDNVENICKFLLFVDSVCAESVDIRTLIYKAPNKRASNAFIYDAFCVDADFTRAYLHAVFGRNTTGVFSGSTPESIKCLYLSIFNSRNTVNAMETGVYSVLAAGFNLLRSGGERSRNLSKTSVLLLRKKDLKKDSESKGFTYEVTRVSK